METTKRVNKTVIVKVIQQYYGFGWEDVSEYDTREDGYRELLRHDVKEYRLTGYSTRVISRRVPNKEYKE